MPSLLDHVDRLSFTTQAIQSTSKQIAQASKGPFVQAVLDTPLCNLARDVDASELGLFTLVSSNPGGSTRQKDEKEGAMAQKAELTRVEFLGATPLRKQVVGRRVEEKEPEVYAEAALKYLEKYQSIRSMSETRNEVVELIERLATLREEINTLSEKAAQQESEGIPERVTTIKGEEKRVQELTARVKQLKARKEILLRKRRPPGRNLRSPAASADTSQDAFWSDPVPRSKSKARQSILLPTGDDSLLLDSHMDMDMNLGEMSMDSFMPPTPLPIRRKDEIKAESIPKKPAVFTSVAHTVEPLKSVDTPEQKLEEEEEPLMDDEAEKTVVLKKAPQVSPSPSSSPPPPVISPPPRPGISPPHSPRQMSPSPTKDAPARPVTPVRPRSASQVATPGTERKSKLRITTETERIVAKIWSTMGEIIMPGHPFDVATAAVTNKPPRAKETIALLQTISSQSPPPSSPSTHSTLSLTDPTGGGNGQPTPTQILTALLLFTLLSNPPSYALPLAKAKEALACRGFGAAAAANPLGALSVGGQALETRALYGCIVKRLLKIDRSGKEQILKFDI